MKKPLLKTAMALTAALIIQAPVQAAEYTLRLAHFFPPVAGQHKLIAQAWADKVKADSNGRIEVEVYPSSTLAKPPAQYDAVKNRIADVTMTIQGYTANRFPLTQVVELPGIAKDAANGSCIIQGLYDEGLIASEYKETHPLFFFTHGPGHIHTTEKLIQKPSDFEGLRIRRPTAVVAKLLEGLGAQPVGMPAPQAYQSVQRGVIDGVSLPWEGQLVFRINELTPNHTEVGGLYTLSFLMTMNKDVYNSMPADLQKVLDDNSGAEWAQRAARVFDDLDVKGRAQAVENGDKIYTVEGGISNPDWKPVIDGAIEEYLSELEAKGLPARKVYARANELAATCN
ncbi:TRAP transporter substrate-binding protein [Amphritea pacifica]|uniref:TRAP transporter substrate-binding protein n=1 Tax=Amphritea pacifica TaxID=2811233 RepID=A0ABS2WBN1_9GAMM|nr:TRAP transporter substrate-binding protein [Amphritea pacifica]MBN0989133.1 TRAP transporter substrate-binding protein [Amphritea pacifica]MBN1008617.1 TRAP transporter substrate-binding protein [Amphritea pacifica]